MCGIFGVIANSQDEHKQNIIPSLIINALNLLKNRGYDSCGIYMTEHTNTTTFLEKYGLDENTQDIFEMMEEKINSLKNSSMFEVGVGHTRWATHGAKTNLNSHPHFSNDKKIKVVHNGIISNYNDLKIKYLSDYNFISSTDTEVIANMIQYLKLANLNNAAYSMEEILESLTDILEGTWACLILDSDYPDKLFFMKNENPLLIGKNDKVCMMTSEPSGFMNKIEKYYLLRDKTFGFACANGTIKINGLYKEIDLIKSTDTDIKLPSKYPHWMLKEIYDQANLNVLIDPITNKLRYNQSNILFNFDYIKPCKYLYIIACGSSYYAGLIASNYFRYTKAFEFVNVFDGGEFTKAHLEAIENPETNLLVLLISQSGETRDLNIATTICREFSSNRKNILAPNHLLHKNDSINNFANMSPDSKQKFNMNNISTTKECNNIQIQNQYENEIKIIGIINVVGSLISRRTIDNIFTNCGRENAVASTKSCTSQIMACLLLAIYKSEQIGKLDLGLKNKFMNDLNRLETDILQIIHSQDKIEAISSNILNKLLNKSDQTNHTNQMSNVNKSNSMFLLGKDELFGSALEGALKIKEIAYMHAEGFNISALKHGPYALIETNTPIIVLYKERDHFVKSIVEEIKTRGAYVIEISPCAENNDSSFILPSNKTFTGLLAVVVLQFLSYFMSVKQNINPDRPRNLAKVVTVD